MEHCVARYRTLYCSKYQNYISRLAMKPVHEEEKGMVMYVDEYMRRQLETKLIEKILEFDTTR